MIPESTLVYGSNKILRTCICHGFKGIQSVYYDYCQNIHLVYDNNDFHRVSKIVPSFSQLFELVMKAVIDARRRDKTQSKNELVL